MLRAAFVKENAANRDVASQVDGASAKHASDCRLFIAQLIMKEQEEGLSGLARKLCDAEGAPPPSL